MTDSSIDRSRYKVINSASSLEKIYRQLTSPDNKYYSLSWWKPYVLFAPPVRHTVLASLFFILVANTYILKETSSWEPYEEKVLVHLWEETILTTGTYMSCTTGSSKTLASQVIHSYHLLIRVCMHVFMYLFCWGGNCCPVHCDIFRYIVFPGI